MLALLELVVCVCLRAGKSDTLNCTLQYLVFSVVGRLLRKTWYSPVEGKTHRAQKHERVFDNSAACFAGLYALLFLILINSEISNEITLFSVMIGIHSLFFSPDWNGNITRKKVHEVNNIEHVERQSLLSFLLALDGWQECKNKHSF